MKPSSISLALVLLLMASTSEVSAITWSFTTTGGGDTISGTLTTDGIPADLGAPKNFGILSIETLLLNGAPVPSLITPLPWVDGLSASVSVGPLIWDGNAVQLPIFVLAESDGGDLLEIDNNPDPNFPNFKARIQGVVEFNTEFTQIVPIRTPPINVPDTGSALSLLVLGSAAIECGRKLRGKAAH